jgi:hypothetical protein
MLIHPHLTPYRLFVIIRSTHFMATVNKTTVIDIYTGVLGLVPPKSAIDWLTSAEYAGKPLDVAANLVLDAFRINYQSGVDDANLLTSASNTNFVKAVYGRIFGFTSADLAAQAEGVNYWTNWLKELPAEADPANGGRGSLISTMLDVAIDKTQYVGNAVVERARALLANRETVAEYSLQKSGSKVVDQVWLREIAASITENTNSIARAKDMIDAVVSGQLITGTTGNDTLEGTVNNDHIAGYAGNDTISGLDGNDALFGGAGHDVLYGGNGNDKLSGGTGNDVFWEDAGNDTYYFAFGDGQDTIHDYGGNKDVIEFLTGIAPSDVQASRSGNTLILSLKNSTDRIEVVDHFQNSAYAIEELHFADGTSLNITSLHIIGS